MLLVVGTTTGRLLLCDVTDSYGWHVVAPSCLASWALSKSGDFMILPLTPPNGANPHVPYQTQAFYYPSLSIPVIGPLSELKLAKSE